MLTTKVDNVKALWREFQGSDAFIVEVTAVKFVLTSAGCCGMEANNYRRRFQCVSRKVGQSED